MPPLPGIIHGDDLVDLDELLGIRNENYVPFFGEEKQPTCEFTSYITPRRLTMTNMGEKLRPCQGA